MINLWRRISAYFDGSDPALQLAGTVAFVVVGNQPFYPLYVWWAAGPSAATTSMVSWLSTPFFAAVPALGRQSAMAAKMLLIAAGIGNTVVCALVLGTASGVELFYLPCLLIAYTLFEARTAAISLFVSLAVVAGAMVVARTFAAAELSPTDNAALVRMHAFSVAGLVAVIAYRLWKNRRR